MKRILQLLPCFYFCLISAWCQAQEPIIISFPETEVQPNAEFCIDVQATNFNSIEGIQFALKWKTEHLNYQSINIYTDDNQSSTYLPKLNQNSNFVVKDGILRFLWINPSSSASSVSEKGTLFQVCFKASATEANTEIQLSDIMAGEAVKYRANQITPVIGVPSIITINEDATLPNEATLSIGSKEVVTGRSFCVPVTAKKLENLVSLELEIVWDEELLSFDELKTTEENPLGITAAANYLYREGYLKFVWVKLSNPFVVEVPDNLVLFELCFEAIGEGGNQTAIEFLNGTTNIEISSEINGTIENIPIEVENGIINITEPIEGEPALLITDALVEPNEEFCLPVLVQDMPPLTGLQFEIIWDEYKLEYQSIELGEDVLKLNESFNPYTISNNSFKIAWLDLNSQNIVFDQTAPLFSLCFKALGAPGEQTLVSFGENVALEATTMTNNIPTIVEVVAQDGIVLVLGNENAVLPGDSDLNDEANHYDLINIGLGYGQTGPARENASLEYTPQAAEDWAASTPITNINYKHADTNGDGIINVNDTEAINLNWTTTPTLVNTIFTEEGVPFYVDTDTLRLIETNQLPIILGTESQVAKKIYSIAFSIYYEAEAMLEDGLEVSLENSWLGLPAELISVQRFFPEAKRIDVAISRVDQEGMTGFGEIGALNIVMEDVILFQREREVKFTIDHVRAIGEILTEVVAINSRPSIAQVEKKATSTHDLFHQEILVYPNPASTEITIASASSLNIKNVELRDIFGKRVSSIYRSNHLYLQELPVGIYFLTVQTDKGSITQKISIQ